MGKSLKDLGISHFFPDNGVFRSTFWQSPTEGTFGPVTFVCSYSHSRAFLTNFVLGNHGKLFRKYGCFCWTVENEHKMALHHQHNGESKSRAMAWIREHHEQWVYRVTELCNCNSGSENVFGLNAAAELLSRWKGIAPVKVQQIALPPRTVVRDDGDKEILPTGPALMWKIRAEANRRVLLGIHYDTVYSPLHHPNICQMTERNKLVGPGVADAKGGIVVIQAALEAIEKFELAPDIGLTVLLTPDEELGSPSSADLWLQQAAHHDFGLLFEPALPSGAMVGERKGSGNFTLVVRGRAAHAGRDFSQGRNAVALAALLTTRLDALNGKRVGTTINVGRLTGGGAVNVVPDLAIIRFNIRVPDTQALQWAEAEINEMVKMASSIEGFRLELSGGFTAPPKTQTPKQLQLMNAVEMAAARLGQRVLWHSSGGVCDGNRLAAAGLPNIDTFGPIGDRLHSPDEWLDTSSIVSKAQLVIELLHGYNS